MDDKTGIQMLLEAEQSAQLIVRTARETKASRLRQVKDEATREAAQYRATRESEFRRKLAQAHSETGTLAKQVEAQTNLKLQTMRSTANRNSAEAVDMLVGYVVNCRNEFGDRYFEELGRAGSSNTTTMPPPLNPQRAAARELSPLSPARASSPVPSSAVTAQDLARARASLPAPAVSFLDDDDDDQR